MSDKVLYELFHFFQDYDLSIGAACVLKWPQERLIVQVIDFSTNEAMKVQPST